MLAYDWIEQAEERIRSAIRQTPLTYDTELNLYLKWENRQITGSFKARGAINKVLSMAPREREKGLVTASAGNHGQGVALAGKKYGIPVIVFCSINAIPTKVEAMRSLGAEVRLIEGGYGNAEQVGLDYAAATGMIWISPYNDPQVIAGQGTICLEVLKDNRNLRSATWLVPVGGGGLISGIGAALKRESQVGVLIGVQPEASAFFNAIYHRGDLENVDDRPTLADGLSGPVEENSMTIPLVKKMVDEFILVSEDEIIGGISAAWQRYGEVIEGSAAAALAAVLYGKVSLRPAVVIISGGNIQPEVHAEIINRLGRRQGAGQSWEDLQ
jgi:threonine dehydratase